MPPTRFRVRPSCAIANFGIPSKSTTLPNTIGSVSAYWGLCRPSDDLVHAAERQEVCPKPADADPAERYFFADFGAAMQRTLFSPATVRALNGMYNHSFQTGVRRPADPDFYPLVAAIRRLQLSRAVTIQVKKRGADELVIAVFGDRNKPELRKT